jgi:hypothetical protein
MIEAFFGQLGVKLFEKWSSLILLPGLLFVAAAVTATVVGHPGRLDLSTIANRVDDAHLELSTVGRGILLLAVALVAAAAAGVLARGLGMATLRWWLGAWPLRSLARFGTERRRQLWNELQERFESLVLAGGDHRENALGLARARNRIAVAEPQRPTWMGDRLAAVESRVAGAYGLDLVACWPRIWLLLPEPARGEVTVARAAVDSSASLAGWGVLYLLLGAVWWPAAIVGVLTWLTAYLAGRNTIAAHAELVESVVDLQGATLARSLDVDCPDAITPAVGREVTRRIRKGS